MAVSNLAKNMSVNAFAGRVERAVKRLFSSVRAGFLFGSATYDAANLVDGAGATSTITVTGAALGDFVVGLSYGVDLQGITLTGYVSAANTVSFRLQNETGGAIDLASTTVRAVVLKRDHMNGTAILGIQP